MGLSKFEWLVLAVALLLCPGFSWSQADEAKNRNWIAPDHDRDGPPKKSE